MNFALNFTMAMFESTFALLAMVKVGFGPKQMGTTFMILGIAGTIVQGWLIGKLVKRFGDSPIFKTGTIFSALGMISILLAPNALLLVTATLLLMVGTSLMGPTSSSMVTKQSTYGQGTSLGIFQSFASLGRVIGPIAGGAFYGLYIGLPYIVGAIFLGLMLLFAGRKIGVKQVAPLK